MYIYAESCHCKDSVLQTCIYMYMYMYIHSVNIII